MGIVDIGTDHKSNIWILERVKGGPGSGHWGHAGRPGKRGGSSPGRGAAWNIYGYSRAVRVAAAEGMEGPKAVIDAIEKARPDISTYAANQYLDVMALDKERFEYYANKLGIENASSLADTYFADMKEIDREVAVKVQEVKDKATYRRRPGDEYVEFVQNISGELSGKAVSGGLVGTSVSEARDLLKEKYGTTVQNVSAEADETIHENVSWLLNMAEADPRIAAVLGKVEKIEFVPKTATSTAAMSALGTTISVYKQEWGHTPSMYVHEMGHVLENVMDAFSGYMKVGGGKGKMYSSYAFTTPSEDFAETFVALFSDSPGISEWAPDKYNFVREQVEALL